MQLLLLEGCSGTLRTSSRELSAYSLAGKSRGGSLPLMHKNNPPKQAALIYPWSTTSVRTESPVFSHIPSVCLVSAVSGMLTGKTRESSLYPVYSQTFILKLSNPQSTICLEFTAGTSLCLIPLACNGSPFGAVSWAGAAAQHCAHLPRPFAILPAIISIPASQTQQNFNIWYKTS